MGVNFRPCSEGYFLFGCPYSVDLTKEWVVKDCLSFSQFLYNLKMRLGKLRIIYNLCQDLVNSVSYLILVRALINPSPNNFIDIKFSQGFNVSLVVKCPSPKVMDFNVKKLHWLSQAKTIGKLWICCVKAWQLLQPLRPNFWS